MRFSRLLTVAGTQLYDLKNALAHQLWLNNIQLLLHMPELLLKLRLLAATALLISSLIATGARFEVLLPMGAMRVDTVPPAWLLPGARSSTL